VKPMTRESGSIVSTGTTRDAKAGIDVPIEVRDHIGAGRVTWAELGETWVIISADGQCATPDE
jgi:hypothetical protein